MLSHHFSLKFSSYCYLPQFLIGCDVFDFISDLDWDPIHLCANNRVCPDYILDDQLRVDRKKVLLVYVLHVLHIHVFHLLWDDDGGTHSQRRGGIDCGFLFLLLFQSLLWVPNPQTGKKVFLQIIAPQVTFYSPWSKCKVALNKVSGTYWHDWNFGECREFQYGGDGIIGHVLWHGQFMAWSHRNLGMWKLTYKCSVALIRKQWRLLSRATLDSNIHFYQSWLWWCLHFQSCLPLSSSWGSNFWIFNIGKVNHWPLNK